MTLALAIWGAVVSTVALLWNIVRDVRTKPQLARSKHIFEPLHAQLSAARIQILACQRANAINLDFWRHLNESGRIKKIPSRLHRPFRDFYSDTFPNYEVAWNTVNAQAVQDLLEPYSEKFGFVHKAAQLGFERVHQFPKWYRFLSAEEFRPALLDLDDERVIPLPNTITTEETLAKAGLTRDQFLRNVWNEARTVPAFRNLCEFRLTALRQISKLLDEISPRIKR